MNDKFRNRILAFYFAGFFNLMIGLYVLFNGRSLVSHTTWLIMIIFFFGFAAVDIWFARTLRRRWAEALQEYAAQQRKDQPEAAGGKADAGSGKEEAKA